MCSLLRQSDALFTYLVRSFILVLIVWTSYVISCVLVSNVCHCCPPLVLKIYTIMYAVCQCVFTVSINAVWNETVTYINNTIQMLNQYVCALQAQFTTKLNAQPRSNAACLNGEAPAGKGFVYAAKATITCQKTGPSVIVRIQWKHMIHIECTYIHVSTRWQVRIL